VAILCSFLEFLCYFLINFDPVKNLIEKNMLLRNLIKVKCSNFCHYFIKFRIIYASIVFYTNLDIFLFICFM
jgi:hypothetical protein